MAIKIDFVGNFILNIRIKTVKDIEAELGVNIEVMKKVKHGGKEYTILADEDGFLKELPLNEYAVNKYDEIIYGAALLVDSREMKIKEKNGK